MNDAMVNNRVVKAVLDDLVRGRTCFVITPSTQDWGEVQFCLGEMAEEYYSTGVMSKETVDLPGLADGPPITALAQFLGVEWPSELTPRTEENFLKSKGLPHLLFFESFSDLGPEQRGKWFRFVIDFEKARLRVRATHPALCIVIRVEDLSALGKASGLQAKLHYWYNQISRTEVEAFYLNTQQRRAREDMLWKAAIQASLLGSIAVNEDLGEIVFRSLDSIYRTLGTAFAHNGWTKSNLLQAGISPHLHAPSFAPLENVRDNGSVERLWSLGLLEYSFEYGWEVPSWVLVRLQEKRLFTHRIWRAQQKIILPIVDRFRLSAIRTLIAEYNDLWLDKAVLNEELLAMVDRAPNLWETELAVLIACLENNPLLNREGRLLPALKACQQIRNSLAHYTPVEFASYKDLVDKIQSVGGRL